MEKHTKIPPLKLTQKDHKGQVGDVQPPRPICSASRTINQRMSDVVQDLLQALFHSEKTQEIISTENFLSKVEAVNTDILEGRIDSGHMLVGHLDVKTQYPSMEKAKAGEIMRKNVTRSALNFEYTNFRWALIYMALNMKPKTIVDAEVQYILLSRLTKAGETPTILSSSTEGKKGRWWYPTQPESLSTAQKKNIMGLVLEPMVITVSSTHIYEFEGKI